MLMPDREPGIAVVLDARIEAGDWPCLAALEGLAHKSFDAVLRTKEFALSKTVVNGAEVSLLFTDDTRMRGINAAHRGQEKPTNVLSFPQHQPVKGRYGPYLGDLVFACETVFREADLENKPLEHHLHHLLVHGFLHLVGYDHECDEDAEEMENLEVTILSVLDVPNPYAGSVEGLN